MGTKSSNKVNKLTPINNSINQNQAQSIKKRRLCPICRSIIDQSIQEFHAHFNRCLSIKNNREAINSLFQEFNRNVNAINFLDTIANTNNSHKTSQQHNQPPLVNEFEDKIEEFRAHLKKMKVDWMKGCNTIEIDRDDIINQSITQFNKLDPYKELKIAFKGEVNHDAGGLIREWLSVLFKRFFEEKTNLLEKADTDNISYVIKRGIEKSNYNSSLFIFIGQLIGKALLENLTINCCFNKIIYKILLDEKIGLDEMIFIDKPLYHSLKAIKKDDNVEDLELYYSLQYETDRGDIKTEELVFNGDNIKVTRENIDQYIFLRIGHLVNTQKDFIDLIKTGINKIISNKILQLLTSDEFELVLNGTPFIDLQDWKESATYKDYKETDFVIVEFWRILSTLTQEDLGHILQFCTGSSRVPIGGFASLESNRGNVSPFCITKCPYIQNSKNYIRAHTCFNRLDIPNFPNKTMLQNSITFILKNEALGFGID